MVVNSPLLRPSFLGGNVALEGFTLDSHETTKGLKRCQRNSWPLWIYPWKSLLLPFKRRRHSGPGWVQPGAVGAEVCVIFFWWKFTKLLIWVMFLLVRVFCFRGVRGVIFIWKFPQKRAVSSFFLEDVKVEQYWFGLKLISLKAGRKTTFFFLSFEFHGSSSHHLPITTTTSTVPGSKLPLFPYNRGWSSTQ